MYLYVVQLILLRRSDDESRYMNYARASRELCAHGSEA